MRCRRVSSPRLYFRAYAVRAEYVTYVLNENFEDAKALFLAPLMAIHYAHLVMLAARGIVSPQDAHTLRVALDSISEPEVRRVAYDGTYEDLFFYVERLIVQASKTSPAGCTPRAAATTST